MSISVFGKSVNLDISSFFRVRIAVSMLDHSIWSSNMGDRSVVCLCSYFNQEKLFSIHFYISLSAMSLAELGVLLKLVCNYCLVWYTYC